MYSIKRMREALLFARKKCIQKEKHKKDLARDVAIQVKSKS
jgi:hypothetical protein